MYVCLLCAYICNMYIVYCIVYICIHVCIQCSHVVYVLCIYLFIHAHISPLMAASTKFRQMNCCSLHHQRTWKVVSNNFIVKSENFQASARKTEK